MLVCPSFAVPRTALFRIYFMGSAGATHPDWESEKWPDDITKVQQHHVLEQQCWESKLGNKTPQSFGLGGGDNVCPPCDVPAQNYPKALQESREEPVDGHAGGEGRGVQLLR